MSATGRRDYTAFLNAVRTESKRQKDPRCFLRDFDQGIANAIRTFYKDSLNLGDLYHLLHDNRKNMSEKTSLGKEEIEHKIRMLRNVTLAANPDSFYQLLNEYIKSFSAREQPYKDYFESSGSRAYRSGR